jgi:hypothetical protein
MIRKGVIRSLRCSWGSGLAELIIDEVAVSGETKRVGIYCENAPTVQALEGCFGGVIGQANSVNQAAIAGKEIFFSTDDLGVLEGFTSTDDAPPEMARIYEEAIP